MENNHSCFQNSLHLKISLTKTNFPSISFMLKWIKIQQTPKYKIFGPNIFSTAKQILKWKTHRRLINPKQEKVPLRFLETLTKFHLWWRNMKIWLHFGFVEGFRKMAIRFRWLAHEARHNRVRPKWDEEGFGKMGILHLVRTSINRLVACLHVSNKLWKCEFLEMGLGQNERKWQREFPQISNVSWVRCSMGFKFENFKF